MTLALAFGLIVSLLVVMALAASLLVSAVMQSAKDAVDEEPYGDRPAVPRELTNKGE